MFDKFIELYTRNIICSCVISYNKYIKVTLLALEVLIILTFPSDKSTLNSSTWKASRGPVSPEGP